MGSSNELAAATTEARLRELLLSSFDGDADAYKLFLRELSGRLRAYFRKRLPGAPEEVEDLVQETLLAVHSRRHTYDGSAPLTAWLHAIARYKLIDLLRQRKVRMHEPLDDAADVLGAVDDRASEARRDLGKLLAQLPDRQRLPIVHMKLEGMSVIETASATGMSESAVKIGVHRGLKKLAAKIGRPA